MKRIIALRATLLATGLILSGQALPGLARIEFYTEADLQATRRITFSKVDALMRAGNYRAAVELMQAMIPNDFPQFKGTLGMVYITAPPGIKRNVPAGLRLLNEAMNVHGDTNARFYLGQLYFEGKYVPKDYKRAKTLLESSGNNPQATLILGRMYHEGLGVPKDYNKALYYFRHADAGRLNVKTKIGQIYAGGGYGVEKNLPEAVKWLEGASSSDRSAHLTLARMYLDGKGVPFDLSKAKQHLYDAQTLLDEQSRKGDKTAKMLLADAYRLGLLGKTDYAGALRVLGEAGNVRDSQNLQGVMYSRGLGGLTKDDAKAHELFLAAATAGSNTAKTNLGKQYYLGAGVSKDLAEAKKWFEEAASGNDSEACYYLGVMHATGEGVEKDEARAKEFFTWARPEIERMATIERDCGCDFGFTEHLDKLNHEFAALSAPSKPDVASASTTSSASASSSASQPAPSAPPPQPRQETAATKPVESTSTAAPKQDLNIPTFLSEVQTLVEKYYPRASVNKTAQSIHFEYKTKKMAMHQNAGRISVVPQLDGIIGDVTIVPGKHSQKAKLPLHTNETVYEKLLLAPYCEAKDCHALSSLAYPSNVPSEFIAEFQSLLSDFEKP